MKPGSILPARAQEMEQAAVTESWGGAGKFPKGPGRRKGEMGPATAPLVAVCSSARLWEETGRPGNIHALTKP